MGQEEWGEKGLRERDAAAVHPNEVASKQGSTPNTPIRIADKQAGEANKQAGCQPVNPVTPSPPKSAKQGFWKGAKTLGPRHPCPAIAGSAGALACLACVSVCE